MKIIRRMRCVLTRSANCLGSEVVISLSVLTSPWLVGAVSSQEWSQRLNQHFWLRLGAQGVTLSVCLSVCPSVRHKFV